MNEWCLAHPYLTTVIILFGILMTNSVVVHVVSLFKKPTPTTVNLNVESPVDDQEDRQTSLGPMN
jgi:hypothetical protein